MSFLGIEEKRKLRDAEEVIRRDRRISQQYEDKRHNTESTRFIATLIAAILILVAYIISLLNQA